jgi:hypothetical protein
VPPQQQDWWIESMLGQSAESRRAALSRIPVELVQLIWEKGFLGDSDEAPDNGRLGRLPVELMNMLRSYFDAAPMSAEEAKGHRVKLMKVRTAFHGQAHDGWRLQTYNFCEH